MKTQLRARFHRFGHNQVKRPHWGVAPKPQVACLLVLLIVSCAIATWPGAPARVYAYTLTPAIVSAPLTTTEAVVATAVVTDTQFGADNTGMADSTAAFNNALSAVGTAGGGVVYAPDGIYKIMGNLTVPNGVTLRGDWATPGPGAAAGTILEAAVDASNPNPFITLNETSVVRNLSIWYPNQGFTSSTIIAYPYTILGTNRSEDVENVTLFNSYQGISLGSAGDNSNTPFKIAGLYATCLLQCVRIDNENDYSQVVNCVLADTVWQNAPSVVSNKPVSSTDMTNLRTYTTANLVGMILLRADDITLYGDSVSDALTTFSMRNGTYGNSYGSVSHVTHPFDLQSVSSPGYADTDQISQANSLYYNFAPVMAPSDKRDFYNVMSYGATGNGTTDDTAAIQSALTAAGGTGGTVYLPPGTYMVSSSTIHLEVPSGVELRGSFDDSHEAQAQMQGTILEPYQGQGTSSPNTDTAFITMDANSGVRGVDVFYPNQSGSSISAYPFTFRSAGVGTWLTDDQIVDGFNAADFGTTRSDNFVVKGLWATAMNEGLVVGAGTTGGWIEEDVIDFGPWIMSTWGNNPDTPPSPPYSSFENYLSANLQAFKLDNCSDLQSFNANSFWTEIHFQIGTSGCSNSSFWATDSDTGAQTGYQINGGTGYNFYALKYATRVNQATYLSTPSGFGGTVSVNGTILWGDPSSFNYSGPGITVYGANSSGGNLLQNACFNGLTSWTVGGMPTSAAYTQSGGHGSCGTDLAETLAGSSYDVTVFHELSGQASRTYTASAWVQSGPTAMAKQRLVLYDQPGGNLVCSANIPTNTASWLYISCSGNVTTGTPTIAFESTGSGASGQYSMVSDVSLTSSDTNLVSDPGIESGNLNAWTNSGGYASVVSDGHSGAYSVKESSSGAYTESLFQTINNLTPGRVYTYAGWYQSSGGQGDAYAAVDATGGTPVLCQANLTRPTSGWTPFSCTAVVPSNGTLLVTFSTIANQNGQTGQWIQGDDLTLGQAS